MPKEIVHFLVADTLRDRLRDTPLGPALSACPNGLRLGAVLHDVLYYLRGRSLRQEGIARLPNVIHSSGSGELLAAQIEIMSGAPGNPAAQAVFAGMVSHMFADRLMHPMVVHFTGNYHDPDPAARTRAVRLHRAMETAMDLAACGGLRRARSFNLKRIRDKFEGELFRSIPLEWAAHKAGVSERIMSEALDSALDTFILVRRIGLSPAIGWLSDLLRPVLPPKAKEITALFYSPYLDHAAHRLRGTIKWRSPTDGTRHEAGLEQLMDRAADLSAELCLEMHNNMQADRTPVPVPAISLEHGGNPGAHPIPEFMARRPLVEF